MQLLKGRRLTSQTSGSGARAAVAPARRGPAAAAAASRPPLRRRLCARAEQAPEEPDPQRPASPNGSKHPGQQGLYRLLKGHPQRSGADHGEAFEQLLPAGGVLRVTVDSLNESLRTNGSLRLRHAMRPDEAFGIILNFDGIVADMNAVRAAAWRALADARDLPLTEGHLRHPELHSMPPEVAAVRMLRWADSMKHGR